MADIIIDDGGGFYGPAIYPTGDYTCNIGIGNKRFKYIKCYDLEEVSDLRRKERIREIKNPLDMVLNMHGVLYDLKKEYLINSELSSDIDYLEEIEKDRVNHYGFIAQELIGIVPEVVEYDEPTDIYGINYSRIIPILVEAIKVQNEMILKLENQIKEKEKGAQKNLGDEIEESYLGKNRPNPFTENTYIEYYLSESISKATLYIYDMNGRQIKSTDIKLRKGGHCCIQGNELEPGMYYYSLIADGKLIGSENMVLTE